MVAARAARKRPALAGPGSGTPEHPRPRAPPVKVERIDTTATGRRAT